MPALYEKLKAQYIAKGQSEDKAQSIAAAVFNSQAKKKGTPFLAQLIAKEKINNEK